MISQMRKAWPAALAPLVIYAGSPTQAAEISNANSPNNSGKSTFTDFAFSFACPPKASAPARHHHKPFHRGHLSHHVKIAKKPFHHIMLKAHLRPKHPHHKHHISDQVCMANGSLGAIMADLDAPSFPSTYTPNAPSTPFVPSPDNGGDTGGNTGGDTGGYPGGGSGIVVIQTPSCDSLPPPPPCNGDTPPPPPLTGAVPEPETWTLCLLGFGAIGFTMRRTGGKKLLSRSLAL